MAIILGHRPGNERAALLLSAREVLQLRLKVGTLLEVTSSVRPSREPVG
jgi:hypothetical protein